MKAPEMCPTLICAFQPSSGYSSGFPGYSFRGSCPLHKPWSWCAFLALSALVTAPWPLPARGCRASRECSVYTSPWFSSWGILWPGSGHRLPEALPNPDDPFRLLVLMAEGAGTDLVLSVLGALGDCACLSCTSTVGLISRM